MLRKKTARLQPAFMRAKLRRRKHKARRAEKARAKVNTMAGAASRRPLLGCARVPNSVVQRMVLPPPSHAPRLHVVKCCWSRQRRLYACPSPSSVQRAYCCPLCAAEAPVFRAYARTAYGGCRAVTSRNAAKTQRGRPAAGRRWQDNNGKKEPAIQFRERSRFHPTGSLRMRSTHAATRARTN